TKHRLLELRDDIVDFGFHSTGLIVDPEVRRFWQVYRSSRDVETLRRLLADPEVFAHDPAEFLDLPMYLQSMLRNELIPFPPEPAPGGGFRMRMIFHLLPGADLEEAKRELLPPWMTGGVAVTFRLPPPPAAISPANHPVVAAIDAELRHDYGRPV